jgi:hypothetical protein
MLADITGFLFQEHIGIYSLAQVKRMTVFTARASKNNG